VIERVIADDMALSMSLANQVRELIDLSPQEKKGCLDVI